MAGNNNADFPYDKPQPDATDSGGVHDRKSGAGCSQADHYRDV